MVQIRTAYDARERVTLECPEEVITEQHHKDACSISTILAQYDRTGLITHVSRAVAQYGDFTEVNEYRDSLHVVMRADEAFRALPSDVRRRFDNDPGAFFEFATDPANFDEMVEMGLAEREAPPAPQKVEVVNPPQSEPQKGSVEGA